MIEIPVSQALDILYGRQHWTTKLETPAPKYRYWTESALECEQFHKAYNLEATFGSIACQNCSVYKLLESECQMPSSLKILKETRVKKDLKGWSNGHHQSG